MPTFPLREHDADWAAQAPVVVSRTADIPAPPDRVFDTMADIAGWSNWFTGMKKVTIDGQSSGVGALRTVWVRGLRVQERFLQWDPGQRLSFVLLNASIPGLDGMVEDYALAPGPSAGTTRITVTIGVESKPALRFMNRLTHSIVASSTKGIAGLATQFG